MCLYLYISPLPHEPPYPIPPIQLDTEPQAGLPMLRSSFPLVICFTHESVYTSVLLSQFALGSPSLAVSTSLFSTSASPILLCQLVPHTVYLDFIYR